MTTQSQFQSVNLASVMVRSIESDVSEISCISMDVFISLAPIDLALVVATFNLTTNARILGQTNYVVFNSTTEIAQ